MPCSKPLVAAIGNVPDFGLAAGRSVFEQRVIVFWPFGVSGRKDSITAYVN